MERRITQRDLVEALGVDVSTVSKALKGDPAVARATVERVRSKAAEIGYVPDPVLGALAAYRQRLQPEAYRATIGWLSDCGPEAMKKRFPAYSDYLQGARERAAELGYRIDPVYLDAALDFRRGLLKKFCEPAGSVRWLLHHWPILKLKWIWTGSTTPAWQSVTP